MTHSRGLAAVGCGWFCGAPSPVCVTCVIIVPVDRARPVGATATAAVTRALSLFEREWVVCPAGNHAAAVHDRCGRRVDIPVREMRAFPMVTMPLVTMPLVTMQMPAFPHSLPLRPLHQVEARRRVWVGHGAGLYRLRKARETSLHLVHTFINRPPERDEFAGGLLEARVDVEDFFFRVAAPAAETEDEAAAAHRNHGGEQPDGHNARSIGRLFGHGNVMLINFQIVVVGFKDTAQHSQLGAGQEHLNPII